MYFGSPWGFVLTRCPFIPLTRTTFFTWRHFCESSNPRCEAFQVQLKPRPHSFQLSKSFIQFFGVGGSDFQFERSNSGNFEEKNNWHQQMAGRPASCFVSSPSLLQRLEFFGDIDLSLRHLTNRFWGVRLWSFCFFGVVFGVLFFHPKIVLMYDI